MCFVVDGEEMNYRIVVNRLTFGFFHGSTRGKVFVGWFRLLSY